MRPLSYLLLLLTLLSGCLPQGKEDTFILAELAWVEDGRQEVEAYLRALQAERIYLTLRGRDDAAETERESAGYNEPIFSEEETAPEQLYLSIAGSEILNQQGEAQQQTMVDWLALMIVDNLADPYAYEQLVIDLQAADGSSLLYQSQTLREILRREPRLRGE